MLLRLQLSNLHIQFKAFDCLFQISLSSISYRIETIRFIYFIWLCSTDILTFLLVISYIN